MLQQYNTILAKALDVRGKPVDRLMISHFPCEEKRIFYGEIDNTKTFMRSILTNRPIGSFVSRLRLW